MEDKRFGWLDRIITALIVGAVAYVLLLFWNTWDLSHPVRIGIAGGLGVLFFFVGRDAWRWIRNIDLWS